MYGMSSEFKVLVADDSRALRLLVRQIIDKNDITSLIYEAENGNQAIEVFLKERPDLVIMDLMMPELDGLEATKTIHRISPNTRIMVLTTSEDTVHVKTAMSNGAADIVPKPFKEADLATKITKLLRQKDALDYKELKKIRY